MYFCFNASTSVCCLILCLLRIPSLFYSYLILTAVWVTLWHITALLSWFGGILNINYFRWREEGQRRERIQFIIFFFIIFLPKLTPMKSAHMAFLRSLTFLMLLLAKYWQKYLSTRTWVLEGGICWVLPPTLFYSHSNQYMQGWGTSPLHCMEDCGKLIVV